MGDGLGSFDFDPANAGIPGEIHAAAAASVLPRRKPLRLDVKFMQGNLRPAKLCCQAILQILLRFGAGLTPGSRDEIAKGSHWSLSILSYVIKNKAISLSVDRFLLS